VICPSCKLENLPSATVCDCGYSFAGRSEDQSVHYLRSIAKSLNSIRRMILCWIVLTLIVAVVGGFIIAMESTTRDNELHRQMGKATDGPPK
jgi:hypothetical protein